MLHPKLISAVLASLQLNQLMIGEAFEEIAIWLDKEGEAEVKSLHRRSAI